MKNDRTDLVMNKILFTFPVVVATHCQNIWQAIEPFVDHLDIPCERFIIGLKARHAGIATYNVSCVIKSSDLEKILKINDFQDVSFSNWLFRYAVSHTNEFARNFNKQIESKYAMDIYNKLVVEDERLYPQHKKHAEKQTLEYAKSINTESSPFNRYNHWILKRLKKCGELKFFDDQTDNSPRTPKEDAYLKELEKNKE